MKAIERGGQGLLTLTATSKCAGTLEAELKRRNTFVLYAHISQQVVCMLLLLTCFHCASLLVTVHPQHMLVCILDHLFAGRGVLCHHNKHARCSDLKACCCPQPQASGHRQASAEGRALQQELRQPAAPQFCCVQSSPCLQLLPVVCLLHSIVGLASACWTAAWPGLLAGRSNTCLCLQEALSVAKQQRRSVQCANLHVETANAAALALYTSLGFREDAHLQDYYAAGCHALHMTLALDS